MAPELTEAGRRMLARAVELGHVCPTDVMGAAGSACLRRLLASGLVAFTDHRFRVTPEGEKALKTGRVPGRTHA